MKEAIAPKAIRQAWLAMTTSATPALGCPDPDQIWDALQGSLAQKEVMAIVQHSIDCPACAEAWRIAKDMGAMDARECLQQDQPAEIIRPASWTLWRLKPLALAAGLACLMVLGGTAAWLWPKRSQPEVEYRDVAQKQIQALTPEAQALPKSACLLKWTPGPVGTRYSVRVSTEQFEPISFVKGLEKAEYLVPADSLQDLQPGDSIIWQVQVFPPRGGKQISGTFFILLR